MKVKLMLQAPKKVVLIVEDNPVDGMIREASAQKAIATLPDKESYEVAVVSNLNDAARMMATQKTLNRKIAAIILDNDFPVTADGVGVADQENLGRGIAFARVTRSTGNNVPILWNSSRFDSDNIDALSKAIETTPPAIAAGTTHVTLDENTEAMVKDGNSSKTIIDFLSRHLGKERSTAHGLGV